MRGRPYARLGETSAVICEPPCLIYCWRIKWTVITCSSCEVDISIRSFATRYGERTWLTAESTSNEALPVEDKYADPGESASTESQAFREHCKKVFDYAVAERKSMEEYDGLRGILLW
jgi:hypothetical protein